MRAFRWIALLAALIIPLFPYPAFADTIVTRSGETYHGKLLKNDRDSYTMQIDKTGETVEIPASQLYLGDFDPSPGSAYRGGAVVPVTSSSERPTIKVLTPPEPQTPAQTTASEASDLPSALAVGPLKGYSKALGDAERTVALHNKKVAETQKVLDEMKAIVEKAG